MVAHTFRPSTQVAEAEFEASLVYREGSREAKATQTLSHKKLKDVIQLFFLIKGSGPPPGNYGGGIPEHLVASRPSSVHSALSGENGDHWFQNDGKTCCEQPMTRTWALGRLCESALDLTSGWHRS